MPRRGVPPDASPADVPTPGDRWTPPDDRTAGAVRSGAQPREPAGSGRSKQALYDRARSLGIAGRSAMSKAQLERAVSRRERGGLR